MSEPDVPRKTRFNPYTMLFLLAGAVAVAYVALGASLFQQHREKEDVMSQLGSGMAVLATADGVRQDVEDLPGRLAEARRELTAAEAAFPSELDSNSILQTVLEIAGESQVGVRSVETFPPVAEPADAESPAAEPVDDLPPAADPTEETGDPRTLTYNVEAEGDFGQLMAFLAALEEGKTSTTRISAFTLQEADGRYLLDFELIAHARSTASEASSPEEESTADEGAEGISDGQETPRE
jgi:hypothetical protein